MRPGGLTKFLPSADRVGAKADSKKFTLSLVPPFPHFFPLLSAFASVGLGLGAPLAWHNNATAAFRDQAVQNEQDEDKKQTSGDDGLESPVYN